MDESGVRLVDANRFRDGGCCWVGWCWFRSRMLLRFTSRGMTGARDSRGGALEHSKVYAIDGLSQMIEGEVLVPVEGLVLVLGTGGEFRGIGIWNGQAEAVAGLTMANMPAGPARRCLYIECGAQQGSDFRLMYCRQGEWLVMEQSHNHRRRRFLLQTLRHQTSFTSAPSQPKTDGVKGEQSADAGIFGSCSVAPLESRRSRLEHLEGRWR